MNEVGVGATVPSGPHLLKKPLRAESSAGDLVPVALAVHFCAVPAEYRVDGPWAEQRV